MTMRLVFWACLFFAWNAFAQESELANFTSVEQDLLQLDSNAFANEARTLHHDANADSTLLMQVSDDSLSIAEKADSVQRVDSVLMAIEPSNELQSDSVVQSAALSTSSVDSLKIENSKETDLPRKVVLYLDGSEAHSAWFNLGVLYAFETYGVRVDSIVGNSYGAWIGALWKSGYSLDEIQRILRHPDVERFIKNQNETLSQDFLPLADSAKPAIRVRLVFDFDSLGNLNTRSLPLHLDTVELAKERFRLHIEESVYRRKISNAVSVVECDGSIKNGAEAILKSMPFKGNLFGVGCQMPLPQEGDRNEIVIVLAHPIRMPSNQGAENRKAYLSASHELSFYKESAVLIRPLQELENTPEAWIQSGFSEVEKKLSALSAMRELKPYTVTSDSVEQTRYYVATPDSIPSELQLHLMSYWNEQDTGFAAIENFLTRVSGSDVYDSVELRLQANGNVLLQASAPLQLDAKAGGFGDNTLGAFMYSDVRIRYVNQFEYELGTSAFYGMGGFGAIPELKLSRLLDGSFGFSISYEFMELRPLQSFLNEQHAWNRIYKERRGDLNLAFDFIPDEATRVTLSAFVGNREYTLHEYYSHSAVKVKPLSPKLEYEYKTPKFEKWFGKNGFDFQGSVGMESVGADFGHGESVPVFWKFATDVNGNVSPVNFLTLGGGAAFGANVYRGEGEDYPPSFGFAPIDMTIRQAAAVTPWSVGWYLPEFRSHQFGLLRANMGLQKGPFGAWIFAAFMKDFENKNPGFSDEGFVFEPALRFAYKSLVIYAGMNRTLDFDNLSDLGEFEKYRYFVKVGNFEF